MNYYLIVGNIRKGTIIDFNEIEEFKKLNPRRLQDIVKFTNSFTDEEELLLYLKYHGLIDKDNIETSIGIYSKREEDEKFTKLRYGISYKEDSELFDRNELARYYIRKLRDYRFFNEFIDKYYAIYTNKKTNGTLTERSPLNYIPSLYGILGYYKSQGLFPLDASDIIWDFITKYSNEYEKLRELAMFAIDYKRRHAEKIVKESPIEIIQRQKMELEHYRDLLLNSAINDEQRENYERHIYELESSIERGGR